MARRRAAAISGASMQPRRMAFALAPPALKSSAKPQ
ncbi:hypothetical protein XaFJ1_GM002971 [Xanthomonas albilineans]|nr:hypothetical protein XaFJ1_GM002971 [Xanthomonas albilineans]